MKVTCILCNKEYEVRATEDQVNKWRGGELIQHAMPNVPKEERELLISGICTKCWDDTFKED